MPTKMFSARTCHASLLAALPLVAGLLTAGTSRVVRAEDPVPIYSTDELGTFFRRWLLCGPVPLGEQLDRTDYQHGSACAAFHRDLLLATGGERAADPRSGEEVTIDGRKYPWFDYQSPGDLIPLDKILRPNELVVAYAFCEVRASRPGKFVLAIGSNDGVKVWVNGECVHEYHSAEGRWLQKDDDYVPIELRSGVNRLLIKIDEGSGDFGFVVRLLNYQETVEKIDANVAVHKELSVMPDEDGVGVYFGRPYAVSLLNPDPNAQVAVELLSGTGQRLATRSVRPGYPARFPQADLPEGPLTFRARFPVSDGKHLTSTIRYYHGKLPRHGVVGLLRDRAMIDASGQPWLPIGFYSAPRSAYQKLKQVGVNFVVAGGADLDAAHQAGLKVGVSVHGQGDGWREHVRDTVRKFGGHPALLFWMMFDEPAFNRADLLDIHSTYELLYKLDPVHPSYLVITRPDGYRTFGRCCDVLAIDTYPVSRGDYRYVGERVKQAYRVSPGDQPMWHCGQLFAWPSDRAPTPSEHRYMTYTSLMAGAKGFLWYAYQHRNWTLPDDDPPLWQAHLRLLVELSDLAAVIVAPGLPEPGPVQGGDGTVHAVIKAGPERTFLFAANDGRSGDVSCTLSVPTEGVSEIAVYGEDRTVRAEQGTIRDTFGPLDVHIYRLK